MRTGPFKKLTDEQELKLKEKEIKTCFTVIETDVFLEDDARRLASFLHYHFPLFDSKEKAEEHIKEAREYFKREPDKYPGYRIVEIQMRSL